MNLLYFSTRYSIINAVIIVNIVDVKNISFVDFGLNHIVSIEQTWYDNSAFSYIDTARPDNGFHLIASGRAVYTDTVGGKLFAKEGDVIYLPKGKKYEVRFSSDGQLVKCILINFVLRDADGKEILLSEDIIRLCNDKSGELLNKFQKISLIYKTKLDRLSIKIEFLKLIKNIVSLSSEMNDFTVTNCGEFIRKNYAERISVPDLAKKCHLSETTFRKRFKEHYLMTATEFIIKSKLDVACEMLRSSEISVEEISNFLGFYDNSYFYKVMKKHKGITPAAYRKKYR